MVNDSQLMLVVSEIFMRLVGAYSQIGFNQGAFVYRNFIIIHSQFIPHANRVCISFPFLA